MYKYMKKKEKINKLLNIYQIIGFSLILITLVLVAIPVSPYVWYRLNPDAVDNDENKIVKVVTQEEIPPEEPIPVEEKKIPPFNPNLPEGYFVLIPSIGVNSPITATKDYKKALLKGTWIVSDFGTPELDELPIILAAHRFGYTSWSNEKRNQISFFNLPRTTTGEKVSIYWNQREYIYEIYALEESTYISDYTADLILYTCKYYNSPERIFRYANRTN